MLEPGRQYNAGSQYRYGFNGKEQDGDIDGTGVDYDYGARIYDARTARWLSSDPAYKDYPGNSPYGFGLDNPIINLDNDGKQVYFCPGLGGHGADKNGVMLNEGGNIYMASVNSAFIGTGIYFKELQGVNGDEGPVNKGYGNSKFRDIGFVLNYGQKPAVGQNIDHRIINAVDQLWADVMNNPLKPDEKINILGTSMGAVTAAQASLYILDHKEELIKAGKLPPDYKIDRVILAGSAVNKNSELYKQLNYAIKHQNVNGKTTEGLILAGETDANGNGGYNFPSDIDGVTGIAGATKVDAVRHFFKLVGQVVTHLINHGNIMIPHLQMAENDRFGDNLAHQALVTDNIEGDAGVDGLNKEIEKCTEHPPTNQPN